MTVNSGGSENDSACSRTIRCAIAWKVPPVIRSAADGVRGAARASMSSAARRVNVSSRMRLAGVPCSRSQAARATSVRVLPVPAPARISSGPAGWMAASRCCSFSPSRTLADSNMYTNVVRLAKRASRHAAGTAR